MNVRNRFRILAEKIKDAYPKLWEPKVPADERDMIHRSIISDIQQRLAEIYAVLEREIADESLDLTYAKAAMAFPERLDSILNMIAVLSLAIKTKLNIDTKEKLMDKQVLADINVVALECYKLKYILNGESHPEANATFEKGIANPLKYSDYLTGISKTLAPGPRFGMVASTGIYTYKQQSAYLSTLVRVREELDQHHKVAHVDERLFNVIEKGSIKLVELRQPKSLTQLAANVVLANRVKLFMSLEALTPEQRKKFPELDIDYIQKLITKVEKILEAITFTPSEQEKAMLLKLAQATKSKSPYNDLNVLIQELDKAFKPAHLSTFKTNMHPVRNSIVRALKEYVENKNEYVGHFGKPLKK